METEDPGSPKDKNHCTRPPPTPGLKKSAPSLRRNSFSATELSNLQALDDDRMSAVFENGGPIENRRISWYDGIKEDSCESLSLTNLDEDDDNGNSSCSASTNSDCSSSRLRKQQLLLSDTKPLFYISGGRESDTPPSPQYGRSFSNDIAVRKVTSQSAAATDSPSRDRLSVTKSYPRKASEPTGLQSTLSVGHFLRHMPPKASLNHPSHYGQSVSGLGYHASANAALRRHRQTNPTATAGATVLGLSAYDNHLAKRSNTERVMEIQHPMKGTLSHMQGLLDSAFALMCTEVTRSIIEGAQLANEVMSKAWMTPRNGRNLAYSLCDYIR